MMADVQTIFSPATDAMYQHLEHLFGGYLDGFHDGLIELAWSDTQPNEGGKYPPRHALMFGTDQVDELVAEAVRRNSQPMCNVYIGAALRKPGTFPAARADGGDVLALTCGYVDLDDAEAVAGAKARYGKAKPSMVVVTGREPHTRTQMWWRLSEPITDQAASQALLKGMASVMHGDSTVTDPPRVMRLAGTIAWPVKPGRKTELTAISPLKEPGQAVYSVEHLARVFPPVVDAEVAGVVLPDGVVRPTNTLGLPGKIADGRERYMTRTIGACLIEYIGETGAVPTAQELFDVAWPQFERNVDFRRPGRGSDEFAIKCKYTVVRFERGKIKGCETVDKTIALYRERERARASAGASKPKEEEPKVDPATGKVVPLLLTAAQFVAGFKSPEYLIDGIIQQSYVYSLTARTGHGKTAVDMYMGAAIARGLPFHGKETKKGAVLFLAGENPDDVRARFLVLAEHEGFDPNAIEFHFVDGVIDIAASYTRICEEAAKIPNLVLVFVDTAAAYFRGDDGNSNAQLGAYARLMRLLTLLPGKPAVVVNCHPVKNASHDNLTPMGGSAFLNEVDGNLTLWSEGGDKETVLHWQGKFRGPEFDAMNFELKTAKSERVKDAKGRLMPSVVAVPISDTAMERKMSVNKADENTVLRLIHADKNISLAGIAKRAGFMQSDGNPAKSKVDRIMARLKKYKLAFTDRGNQYVITEKGCKAINVKFGGDYDDE